MTAPTLGGLDDLAAYIREINEANGWNPIQGHQFDESRYVASLLALIHSEVSEALEEVRVGNREAFLEEMADVLIRTLDLVGGLTTNFDSVVWSKLEKNKSRGHRHGGKRV